MYVWMYVYTSHEGNSRSSHGNSCHENFQGSLPNTHERSWSPHGILPNWSQTVMRQSWKCMKFSWKRMESLEANEALMWTCPLVNPRPNKWNKRRPIVVPFGFTEFAKSQQSCRFSAVWSNTTEQCVVLCRASCTILRHMYGHTSNIHTYIHIYIHLRVELASITNSKSEPGCRCQSFHGRSHAIFLIFWVFFLIRNECEDVNMF